MARGRHADTPTDIPGPGWKDVILRVKDGIGRNNVVLIAAGVAFYGLLALFPAITALTALAGLLLDPSEVARQIGSVANLLPPEAAQIVLDQAVAVAGSPNGGLGLAFLFGLLLALYSASNGVGSLMAGLNIAYGEKEERGFVTLKLVTLGLTLLLIVGLIVGLGATIAVPAVLAMFDLPGWLATGLGLGRWVVLVLLTIAGLAMLYRWGPSRKAALWRWLSPGVLVACGLWLGGSILFSVYVTGFGSYNQTFGSMAGVIVLLIWLWLSAFTVLLGAELNAEIEAQTLRDSTTGRNRPMGERGARKADVPGESMG